MEKLSECLIGKLKYFCCCLCRKLVLCYLWFKVWLATILHILLVRVSPFWAHVAYFHIVTLLGFLSLKATRTRTAPEFVPRNFDLFFTAVSATTGSSMSTVEMEVFSNTQLAFFTIMMLLGGEVFVSMLGLYLKMVESRNGGSNNTTRLSGRSSRVHSTTDLEVQEFVDTYLSGSRDPQAAFDANSKKEEEIQVLKSGAIKSLFYIVSCYFLAVHAIGSAMISIYFSLTPSAKKILKSKGLRLETFSIFHIVSTFANCGFLLTNENMMVFRKHTWLLLLTIPQALIGNTLYPACLRGIIYFLERVTGKQKYRYMLENYRELGHRHLLSRVHCIYLAITCLGLVLAQLTVFCSLEWNSKASEGLNGYEKFVGSLFQVVNSRHAGESVFDLSAVSSAVLVLTVFMMYLPPYTTFLPLEEAQNISTSEGDKKKRKNNFWGQILFSQLTYLTIFIILVCIIEREKMTRDPLNFNVLSITVEVISAYGNVGFSVGYNCRRRMNLEGECKNASYGFVGRWSGGGKAVLILVMLFGRFKKFNMKGGKAWDLS